MKFINIFLSTVFIFGTNLCVNGKDELNLNLSDRVSKLWSKFWTISCQFSTVESRVKRSIHLPDPENPVELFNYLFPLVSDKLNDSFDGGSQFQSRSQYTSTWIDDVMDLWHSECHRRSKMTSGRRKTSRMSRQHDMLWSNYAENISYYTDEPSTTPMAMDQDFSEEEEEVEVEDEESEESEETQEEESDDGIYRENSMDKGVEDDSTTTDTPRRKKKKKQETTTTSTTTTTTTPAPQDPYFPSYGGDVEYFYPLISFGIPFDGEITVLGFHGFKGLLPY